MNKPKPLPPVEVLNELLEYNPDTGVLRWRVNRGGHEGKVAGSKDGRYIRVEIMRKKYRAHRIIWKMVYGNDPDVDKVIDHINQVRDDNRLCNLRLVSVFENNLNGGINKPGATGISYIYWEKYEKRYRVRVKRKHIGYCKTLDGAIEMLQRYNDSVV
jgi:hypothetical protein